MERVTRFAQHAQAPLAAAPTMTAADAPAADVSRNRPTADWPTGPVAMVAAELLELCENDLEATIQSLLDLCHATGRDEVVLLDVDYGLSLRGTADIRERINMLQNVILRVSRLMGAYPPLIELRQRGSHFDLRVCPGLPLPEAA